MSYDVCVIGAGPGGYVAAIKAAQLGLKTVIIEREKLGGVCLNVGCIPSKAMITAAHFLHKVEHESSTMGIEVSGVKLNMPKLKNWKQSVSDRMAGGVEQLLKGNKVEIVQGDAEFTSANDITVKSSKETRHIKAKNFVVATGSRPIEIPGFSFDEKTVMSSTGALDLEQVPKKLITIGGGYIGLEISSYLAELGCEVTILEAADGVLKGAADPDCIKVVERQLKKQGNVKVHTKAFAKSFEKKGSGVVVKAEVNGKVESFEADKILVTVGRKPNSDQMKLKQIGLNIDDRGFVKVDAQMRSNIPHIFAIGDIAGQPMLAHKASHEGVLVAEVMAGHNRVYDAKTVPAVIFTHPEIASAGWTEEECKAQGYSDLKVNKFPFAANGRAVSLMETDGFVKMIADNKTHRLLGVHICGPEASNLISEAVLAIEMGARLEDLALSIHPHPTLGETMMEAAEATLGHAIHMINKPVNTKKSSAQARV
ncbi:MAG: dihydrolipoyl dehydrogenase [Bdellovibrionales bacterium]|nr:dihydrolipoyl dehydrogenase [Bdellovibrionales bacterium]